MTEAYFMMQLIGVTLIRDFVQKSRESLKSKSLCFYFYKTAKDVYWEIK